MIRQLVLLFLLAVPFTLSGVVGCTRGSSKVASGFLGGIYLSEAQSLLSVSSNTLISGTSITVTLTTKDQNGATYISPDPLTISFSTMGGTSAGTFSSTSDNGDGTYTATFSGTMAGTTCSLHASINSQEASGTLPSITVHSGAYSSANSYVTLSSTAVASGSGSVATLHIRDNSNNPLAAGGLTVAFSAVGGLSTATFSATVDNLDGTYTSIATGVLAGTATAIHASIGAVAVTSASPSLTVTHGPASMLAFTTQPSGAVSTAAFTGQPVVEIRDAAGNRVTTGTDATASLTMSITTGGGTLAGTVTVTAVAGLATWTDLSIDTAGAKTVTATKPNLTGSGGTAAISQVSASFTNVSAPPPVPTGLAAITSSGSVALTWTASTGAASYNILRGATAGTLAQIATSATASYTDATALNGSTYYYAVQSVRASGTSVSSTALQVTLIAAFTMTTATPYIGYAAVAWNSAAGATTYDILYDTVSRSGGGSYASSVTGVASGASVTGLSAGTTYYFRVRANSTQGTLLSTNELAGSVYQSLAFDIPFTGGTETSYIFNSATRVDLPGAVARLTPAKQTDDVASTGTTSGGFRDGSTTSAQWDSSLGALRLNATTNTAELDASWTPQWSSLSGYWKFNEASWNGTAGEVVDSSGKNHPGVRTGTAAISTLGKLGSAGTFPATSASILLPASSNFISAANAPFTITAWIYPTSMGTSAGAIDNRVTSIPSFSGSGSTLVLGVGNTNRLMYFNAGDGTFNSSTAVIDLNVWTHVSLIYTGTCFQLVINGIPDGACAVKSLGVGGSTGVRLGSYAGSSSNWAGRLDDIAMWSSALTTAQVQLIFSRQSAKFSGLYQSSIMDAYTTQTWKTLAALTTLPFGKELPGASGSETSNSTTGYSQLVGSTGSTTDDNLMLNLAGYWKLNETSGTFADSSGNSNTATAVGAVLSNDCSSATLPAACRALASNFGNGVLFNGNLATADYVNIPNSSSLQDVQESDSTFSVWFKPYITNKTGTIFGKNGYNLGFVHQTDGKILFQVFDSANTYFSTTSTAALSTGQWHHLLAILNVSSKTLTLYVDGVATTPKALGATFATYEYGTNSFRIGTAQPCSPAAAAYCSPANGAVDEVAIWGRALYPTEVKQLYRRGANRIKYQVRTCTSANCATEEASAGQGWAGPNNSNLTYFSELYNTASNALGAAVTSVSPLLTFANFNGTGLSLSTARWFQYRAILESDDATTAVCTYGGTASACSPELRSVAIGPNHYETAVQTITSKAAIGKTFAVLDPSGFSTTGETCTGVARYAITTDGSTFYYWNTTSSAWTAATIETYAQASPSIDVKNHIDTFAATAGAGTLQVKTFLTSTGETPCEIDNIRIDGKKY